MTKPANKTYFVYIALMMALTSCDRQPDIRQGTFEPVNLQNAMAELSIPKILQDDVSEMTAATEDALEKQPATKDKKEETVGPADGTNTMTLVPFHVRLMEEDGGTLKNGNVELMFGKGGGTLDMADYVDANGHGDLIFGVDVPGFNEAFKAKVLFLNNGKIRRLDNQIYGTPCDMIFDISTYFRTKIAGPGMRTSSRQKLYMSMIVGTYIIGFATEDGKWSITQLTITDSRYPEQMCRSNKPTEGA